MSDDHHHEHDPVSAEMQVIKMMRINKGGAYATATCRPICSGAGMTVTVLRHRTTSGPLTKLK